MRRPHMLFPARFQKWGAVFFLSVFLSGCFAFPYPVCGAETPQKQSDLNDQDLIYLYSIYQDTWNYLSTFVDANTGLPYDSSQRQPPTSLTNIGLYLASVSAAYKTALISAEEAGERVLRCLESLDRIPQWRNFPRPWVIAKSLRPTHGEIFNYGPHLAALIGGLLVTEATFPEAQFDYIHPRIQNLLTKMDFKSLYEPETGWLKGGYDLKANTFAIYQPWGHWYYKFFASEIRLLSFYLIARGIVPTSHWFRLIRPMQEKDGETFFVTGYEDGGMYVPYFAGLFLDERRSEMGRSQQSLARYQIQHARKIGAPAWGWSACLTVKGRYLSYGELRDDIVNPHASFLAALYFPAEAVQNLRRLEKMGARPSESESFGSSRYGFRDSVNWQTGEVAPHYLMLNQGMGFLALANLLFDGLIWRSFREAPVVDKRIEILNTELEIIR